MRTTTTNTTHGRDVQGVGGMHASRSECRWPCEGFCRDCCASNQWIRGGNQLENACGYYFPIYVQNRTQRLQFRLKAFTLVSLSFIIVFANSFLNLYRARHARETS